MKKYLATMRMRTMQMFDGNLLCVAAEHIVRFVKFFILTLVWRSLAAQGADLGGMELGQLLTYTLMASALRQQLEIVTPATASLWEGSIIRYYTRPVPVLGGFVAETIGQWWIPVFLIYTLPLLMLAPLLGISPLPAGIGRGLLAVVSLALGASLGFALDFLFAAFAMNMKNGCWMAMMVREAIFQLLSGAVLPFALFPWGLGRVFSLLPFGSIANAPLSIYVGTGEPVALIGLQIFWNAVLWCVSIKVYHKSEERMISFGG